MTFDPHLAPAQSWTWTVLLLILAAVLLAVGAFLLWRGSRRTALAVVLPFLAASLVFAYAMKPDTSIHRPSMSTVKFALDATYGAQPVNGYGMSGLDEFPARFPTSGEAPFKFSDGSQRDCRIEITKPTERGSRGELRCGKSEAPRRGR